MSTATFTQHKINTTPNKRLHFDPLYLQIVDVLRNKKLSFQELSEYLEENDEDKLSADLNSLVHAGIISLKFDRNQVSYTLAQHRLQQPLHMLYKLERGKV